MPLDVNLRSATRICRTGAGLGSGPEPGTPPFAPAPYLSLSTSGRTNSDVYPDLLMSVQNHRFRISTLDRSRVYYRTARVVEFAPFADRGRHAGVCRDTSGVTLQDGGTPPDWSGLETDIFHRLALCECFLPPIKTTRFYFC